MLRRNCLLKHVIEEKREDGIEVTRIKGRRCKQLLNDIRETRPYRKFKEEELQGSRWRTRFGRIFFEC
jgi:hypothetical protein